jgi:hypothetical protein
MIDSFAPIPSDKIDVQLPAHDGYPEHLAAGDTAEALLEACGDASVEFPDEWWIEPKDWPDWARENDKYHTWALNYVDRFTHQKPTHECTCHSLSRLFESARNLARGVIFTEGPKKNFRYEESAQYGSVWVSPLSVYAEANPGQWGGASIRQVLNILTNRGFLPDKIQPRDYGFKHTLHGTAGQGNNNQSSGKFVRVSQFPEGWQETAKHFRADEVILNLKTWEQAVCLILRGRGYGVGRDGHAIPWMIWNPKENAMGYTDSYDVIRWDSLATVKRAFRGGYSIISTSTPDDWLKPAE